MSSIVPRQSQAPSGLLDLPAELRLDVYEFIAMSISPIRLRPYQTGLIRENVDDARSALALLSTCKLVRSEAYNIFWEKLQLDIAFPFYGSPVPTHLRALGSVQRHTLLRTIRHVHISIYDPADRLSKDKLPGGYNIWELHRTLTDSRELSSVKLYADIPEKPARIDMGKWLARWIHHKYWCRKFVEAMEGNRVRVEVVGTMD